MVLKSATRNGASLELSGEVNLLVYLEKEWKTLMDKYELAMEKEGEENEA